MTRVLSRLRARRPSRERRRRLRVVPCSSYLPKHGASAQRQGQRLGHGAHPRFRSLRCVRVDSTPSPSSRLTTEHVVIVNDRHRRAAGVPPGGHDREAADEQQVQGPSAPPYISLAHSRRLTLRRPPLPLVRGNGNLGLLVYHLIDHLQGVRDRAARPQAALALPGSGVRRGVQGHAADIQVWGAAVVLGHPGEELQGELYERVWGAEGEDDDAGYGGQVSPTWVLRGRGLV